MLDAEGRAAEVCGRIARADGRVRAFVPEAEREERLRGQARELDARPGARELPLYGEVFGAMDIVRVDGLPTRAGSALPSEALAGPQATAVTRLLAAGALVAGKTRTSEFAISEPEHTAGGSGGGSAAAVAAGLVRLAIGAQTVGSAVRPAAFRGVAGYVVSHGRVPMDGVLPVAPTLDTLAVFAPDAAGAARAAARLLDDWREPAPDATPPVLGIPDGPYLRCASLETLAAFERQVARLRTAGHTVRRVQAFEDFGRLAFHLFVVNVREMADCHARLLTEYADLYQEGTLAPIRSGQGVKDADYDKALAFRREHVASLAATTAAHGVDLWIAPSVTGPAPHGRGGFGDAMMSLPWSGAGLPCVTLPAGRAKGIRLPPAIQLVAAHGADERLLRWASGVEAALRAGE